MSNNEIQSWEDWKKLKPDVREYALYTLLKSFDKRLRNIENRKWKTNIIHFAGSFMAGILFWLAYLKVFTPLAGG